MLDDITRDNKIDPMNKFTDDQAYIDQIETHGEIISLTPHPWVRYLARGLDTVIGINLISFVIIRLWLFVAPSTYTVIFENLFFSIFYGIFVYCVYLVFESFIISKYGTTIGKWIFNTYVTKTNEEKLSFYESFNRSFLVLIKGEGFSIPIFNLVANFISYKYLSDPANLGRTKWDIQTNSIVKTNRLQPLKITIGVIIIFLFYYWYMFYNIKI